MKRTILIFGILLALFSFGCFAGNTTLSADSEAVVFAIKWLNLLDDEMYDMAWNLTSEEFREDMSIQQWMDALKTTRRYTPIRTTRHVSSAVQSSTLYNLNKQGEYVTVDITTESTEGDSWREIVVLVKKEQGWKVIGHSPYKK